MLAERGWVVRELSIAGVRIADDEPAWVCCEIGHNHQGSVQTAKELIKQAVAAGASSVKFQKRSNKDLYTPEQFDRPYHSENAYGPTYGLHREALEFDMAQYRELKSYAESLGTIFFATAFDLPSVDFLDTLGVPAIKIASFDVRSTELISYASGTGVPLIISTGTATGDDVIGACIAAEFGKAGYALLHGTSEYPAPPEHLNLQAIPALRAAYPETVIGYSNHFSGISMPLVAYVLGARIIEMHFTLNRAMKGTDQPWSVEPSALAALMRHIAKARAAMGDGIKRPIAEEMPALEKAGKELPLVNQ